MKSKIIFITIFIMSIFLYPNTINAQDINININGELKKFDAAPFIKDGYIYVPIRGVFETLGMDVKYKLTDKNKDDITAMEPIVEVTSKNRLIQITSHMILCDGLAFGELIDPKNSTAIINKNDRLFIRIRPLAQSLHMDINWNEKTKTVSLKNNNDMSLYPLYSVTYDNKTSKNIFKETDIFTIQWQDGNYIIREFDASANKLTKAQLETVYEKYGYFGIILMDENSKAFYNYLVN